jgi:hypothetical protein
MSSDTRAIVNYLLSPQAIRDRSRCLFDLACGDQLDHFRCDLEQLPAVADYVIQLMQTQYPDGNIPVHSRWRHFEIDGESRLTLLEPALSQLDVLEQARLKVDLAIVSVLLDAGAGADWCYREPGTGLTCQRSEGLAMASFHSFRAGLFSSYAERPWQADAVGLSQITADSLAQSFQVNHQNPLVGIAGRAALLQTLGQVLQQNPTYFGRDTPRPGGLVDYWLQIADAGTIAASTLLTTILRSLGDIWPGRLALAGVNLGDVWPHPQLAGTHPTDQLMPFHKLSQWLTYSLLEPLQTLGLGVTGLEALTGLAEYRNGGLFIDMSVLVPKHAAVLAEAHPPGATVIVEWRALTVQLLDRLAEQIRQQLHKNSPGTAPAEYLAGGHLGRRPTTG